MEFSVYKASIDGISGTGRLSLEEAVGHISYSKGWADIETLRTAIRRWAKKARPGQAFPTAASVIVCERTSGASREECDKCLSEDVTYEDFGQTEDGDVEQECTCNQCGHRWIDVFAFADRRVIAGKR